MSGLEDDLTALEAADPAVAEAAARLDETTSAIVADARFATGGLITGAAQMPVVTECAYPALGESTSARLRRVEQERDRLALVNAGLMTDSRSISAALDLARAELASARTEVEQLRYSGWIVARDGGLFCERCKRGIRRGEAYAADAVRVAQNHVHCPIEGES